MNTMRTALALLLITVLCVPGNSQDREVPVHPKLVTTHTRLAIQRALKFLAR